MVLEVMVVVHQQELPTLVLVEVVVGLLPAMATTEQARVALSSSSGAHVHHVELATAQWQGVQCAQRVLQAPTQPQRPAPVAPVL